MVLSGCVSGPELNSKLGYLNKANYKKSSLILGVPVGETKTKKIESDEKESLLK